MPRGQFITLEGPEGAGKSTQLALLADWLRQQGVDVVVTREPGGTRVGDRIRQALFGSGEDGILPLTEALLMSAARAQHVQELLLPALAAGKLVLCDRYADATIAYQGSGRGLDTRLLRQLVDIATAGLLPDLTVYFDVPAETGLARKLMAHGQGGELNHLDRMELAFHERVIAGYRELIATAPERWRVLDASQPLEEVQRALRAALQPLLTTSPSS